jgi:DnaJ domain
MASYTILRFIGWAFLPDLATRYILRVSSSVKFLPSSYATRYRCVYSFVVLVFLCYNLVEGARTVEPNLYDMLGVNPLAEEQTLKLAFRQFAKRYHPDKLARNSGSGDDVFIAVRDAFEALKNPVVRFAYDRLVSLCSRVCAF